MTKGREGDLRTRPTAHAYAGNRKEAAVPAIVPSKETCARKKK